LSGSFGESVGAAEPVSRHGPPIFTHRNREIRSGSVDTPGEAGKYLLALGTDRPRARPTEGDP